MKKRNIFFVIIINIIMLTNSTLAQIKYAKSDYNIGLQTSLLNIDGEIYSKGYYGGQKDFSNDYIFSKYDGNAFNQLSKSEYNFPDKVIDEFEYGYSTSGVNIAKTNNNGLYSIYNNKVYNYNNKEWNVVFERDSFPKDSIKYITNSICSDKFNNLYFIQTKLKLLYITPSGQNVSQNIGGTLFKITDNKVSILIDTIYQSDNFSDYLISNSTLTIDNNNNLLLLGLSKLGILNLNNNEVKTYNYEDKNGKLDLFPTSLVVTKDNEYIITFKGKDSKNSVSIFKDNKWNSLTIDDGYDFSKYFNYLQSPNCIFKSKDNSLWIGSRNGVLRLKDKNVELIIPEDYHFQQYENNVKAITEDKNGNVIIGTTNGLLIYNLDATSVENITQNPINIYPNPVNDLLNINIDLSTEREINYKIYDMNSKLVGSNILLNNQIDVSNLSKGAYNLEIITSQISNKIKFIKE